MGAGRRGREGVVVMVIGRLAFLIWRMFLSRTGVHPRSSRGQAFAATCAQDWIMVAMRESRRARQRTPGKRGQNKNTGDLQWKFTANYNARPCADERKDAGAGTMGVNGKTMRRTMETMKNTMERLLDCPFCFGQAALTASCFGDRDNRQARATNPRPLRDLARLKSKTRPKRSAADARMSLCTYCHAPLAPETQAEFSLSPLFTGAPVMDDRHAFDSSCRRRPTDARSSIARRDLTDGQQGRRHTSGAGRPSNRTSLVEWLLGVPARDHFEPDERACCPSRDRPAASSASRRDPQGATCGSTIRRSHVLRSATNGR